jgi:hypothetical protein
VPEWSLADAAPAEWTAEELAWGPLYEPHRHADGATLVDRVRIAAARLEIEADASLPLGVPPRLLIRTEEQPPSTMRVVTAWDGTRLRASFRLPAAVGPIRLALEGGSPFLLRRIRIDDEG